MGHEAYLFANGWMVGMMLRLRNRKPWLVPMGLRLLRIKWIVRYSVLIQGVDCVCVCLTLSVSDADAVRNTIASVVNEFGKLDVFIANAGKCYIKV